MTEQDNLDFSLRLNGYDPKAPELLHLVDAVNLAAYRADGILHALYWAHENKGDVPTSEHVCAAVDSVVLEVKEIAMLLNHYFESTRKRDGRQNEGSN